MNPRLAEFLDGAEIAFNTPARRSGYRGRVKVGVDFGTTHTVLVVLDDNGDLLSGRYRASDLARDGLIFDIAGAIRLLAVMKAEVEQDLGFPLSSAATAFPPRVGPAEVETARRVLKAVGFSCPCAVDQPTAANAVLQLRDGAVVDVGGGTTGLIILRHGEVIYRVDEPTGGTQITLALAGGLAAGAAHGRRPARGRMRRGR